MRQTKHILPLLLIIALLCGALYLVSPGGPLYQDATPPADKPEADAPAEKDPSQNDPSPDDPSQDDPSQDTPSQYDPSPDDPPATDDPPVVNPPVVDPPVDNPPVVKPPVVVPNYQYSCDVSFYMDAINKKYDRQDLLLVNKTNPLGEYYVPSNLVYLNREDTGGENYQLDETAALALHAMMMCMRADGITNTYVTSAYRSYKYQLDTHNGYILKERAGISAEAFLYFGYDYIQNFYLSQGINKLTLEDARALVLSYSAPPGYSEHQTGLCVDFITANMTGLTNAGFEPTAAFRWLKENACQFGFILRYPKDKVDTTGYSYESWHFRFVGKEAAIAITERGITLEEYLAAQ
jgi:D-alanyl-D-alanine carboxypeptidase